MTYVKNFEKGPQDFAGGDSICLAFAFACVVNSTMKMNWLFSFIILGQF